MSERRRKHEGPMPASSAGLLRFFEDEAKGVKVRPELVVSLAGSLIVLSILLRMFLPAAF